MKEYERASMEEFIENTRTLLTALNYRILEPLQPTNSRKEAEDILYLKTSKAYGTGYLTSDNKFVIKAGSKLSETTALKCPPSAVKAREQAVKEKKVIEWALKEDILFSSSSQAAAFLAGFSISGPEYWKDRKGKPLKSL